MLLLLSPLQLVTLEEGAARGDGLSTNADPPEPPFVQPDRGAAKGEMQRKTKMKVVQMKTSNKKKRSELGNGWERNWKMRAKEKASRKETRPHAKP